MAVVTYPDGRVFEIADGDVDLADYYRGEGADVSGDIGGVQFPRVYVEGGDTYIGEDAPVVDEVVPEGDQAGDAERVAAAAKADAERVQAEQDEAARIEAERTAAEAVKSKSR